MEWIEGCNPPGTLHDELRPPHRHTPHAKNEYYLEVEGLKYRIFELDHGKVQADDQYGSAQRFRYQNNLDGFDGSVYAGTRRGKPSWFNRYGTSGRSPR